MSGAGRARQIVTAVALLAILAGGAYVRLWRLVPAQRGIDYAADTDEGAYAFSAQLLLQGQVPYRDFFATLPPLALYLFAGVQALFLRPWGSLGGFMALRYASVVYGLVTILVAYALGRRLGGRAGGLLAAAVLACDGIVIAQDRRAMLEAPMNLFSALAVLAYLVALERERAGRWWLALAGALSAAAVLLKSPAAVVPLVLLGATLARRRWGDLLPLLAGGIGAGLLLAGPFLILCAEPFLKQVYAFQLLRPPDGLQGAVGRLREIWSYPSSWLTVRLGGLGLVFGLWRWRRAPARRGWLLAAAWAGATALVLLASQSYWATYFAPLAVPLAVLAAGAAAPFDKAATVGEAHSFIRGRIRGWLGSWLAPDIFPAAGLPSPAEATVRAVGAMVRTLVPIALLLLFALWAALHVGVQYQGVRRLLASSKPAFAQVAQVVAGHSSTEATVLATDPLYAMLASRPPARGDGRPYMPDTYGGMLYRNLGLAEMSWADTWALRAANGGDPSETERQFARPPAQEDVLAGFARCDYVVIDRRARRQWTADTIGRIEAGSAAVLTIDDVTLRTRTTP